MTIQELQSEILNILQGYIGTYTFKGGATTTAIRVEDGQDRFIEEPSISGLEVVIVPEQDLALTPLLGNGKRLNYTVQIALKQFDRNESTKPARELLLKELPVDSIQLVPRSDSLRIIEVCTLAINEGVHYLG